MALKKFFEKASNRLQYLSEVTSTIPSQDIKDVLEAKGWKFELTPAAHSFLDGPLMPYGSGVPLPLETVLNQDNIDIFREAHADIARYNADKKAAAKLKYGL